MSNIKVSEASGAALDWMVARACGDETLNVYFTEAGHKNQCDDLDFPVFNPSTDWAQGGPIIEREQIALLTPHADVEDWEAYTRIQIHDESYGPTPLIAAMRCFVSSRLGPIVEVPGELL
jgi:hypothetical protein